mmetsp:Transcript_1644/g.2363  ORF Transcript_1644/g.2363 Transcript_1644/m.2363 type:complete len:483 (+) Transcript_1644:49-1497(+)|eukprot:CAMPEP_0203675926 /NCGR_PEP_ID=MMETSP0090-20130426/22679_1 /ASSEMBLY_ACC=CAM_ASM_001088 /TAXON_ID=426623 /ORGANISM="Chaetoceros affinis, Strain CCMP159" /LENGTH=482 /DNA_ID=CAMNT_0050542297 /DNA_START=15 /DNA_END=1463 /DNA_ORIENTATION=-
MSLIIQDIVSSLSPKGEEEDFLLDNAEEDDNDSGNGSTTLRAPAEIAPIHAISLASNLLNLYNKGIATDVVVICENETFKLHSAVLIHGSQYFRTVLDFQEYDPDEEIRLDFTPSIQPNIFRAIVESLYTGIVRNMNFKNISSLLEASYHLDIEHSYNACVNYMISNIDHDNCLEYWLSAKLCQSTKVKNKAIGLIGRHLDSFSSSDIFLGLQSHTVLEILKDEKLLVSTEKSVYEAAMAWIKYDEEERVGELSSLLDTVRLTYLPVFYLVNVVGKEDMIENDPVSMSKYSKALKLKLGNSHGGIKRRHNPVHGAWSNVEIMKKKSEVGSCLPKKIDKAKGEDGASYQSGEFEEDINVDERCIDDGKQGPTPSQKERPKSFFEKFFPKKESNDESTKESLPSIVDDTDTDTEENEGYTDSIIGQRFSFTHEPLENVPEVSDEDLSEIQSKSDSKTGLSFAEETSKSNEGAILTVDDDSFDAC